jgi:hypothetical protein
VCLLHIFIAENEFLSPVCLMVLWHGKTVPRH